MVNVPTSRLEMQNTNKVNVTFSVHISDLNVLTVPSGGKKMSLKSLIKDKNAV